MFCASKGSKKETVSDSGFKICFDTHSRIIYLCFFFGLILTENQFSSPFTLQKTLIDSRGWARLGHVLADRKNKKKSPHTVPKWGPYLYNQNENTPTKICLIERLSWAYGSRLCCHSKKGVPRNVRHSSLILITLTSITIYMNGEQLIEKKSLYFP